MKSMDNLRKNFLNQLKQRITEKEPQHLYDPVHYILDLGGKRLRPLLTLMSAQMFGGRREEAMDAAIAVEVFHNFTLVHDDIMDEAALRRGKPTVHEKWDLNTGILSGDAMLIMAYRLFESYPPEQFYQLNKVFSATALEVCEGQQYDIDFETRDDVEIDEYLLMIKLKTSVLVGCALQMGAIVAGAAKEQQELVYDYGIQLGLAFQLMDDYLDAFGDPESFGKEVGGDIRENKKTFLYLKSLEDPKYAASLKKWFAQHHHQLSDEQIRNKKEAVKKLFTDSGGAQATLDAISSYTQKALNIIDQLAVADDEKEKLRQFSLELMGRQS
ncbi:polyprenyl synthetase family protein [Nonlabens xiamenensis]|uniref:polyprenyl synthetase family protein n=1 Tax=Nonlabens xiamenensis TaxID=2341043 RepID=UPI000F609AC8|nr:polyprenyl synthetase family protein [Nonlabens xiamenensis]